MIVKVAILLTYWATPKTAGNLHKRSHTAWSLLAVTPSSITMNAKREVPLSPSPVIRWGGRYNMSSTQQLLQLLHPQSCHDSCRATRTPSHLKQATASASKQAVACQLWGPQKSRKSGTASTRRLETAMEPAEFCLDVIEASSAVLSFFSFCSNSSTSPSSFWMRTCCSWM